MTIECNTGERLIGLEVYFSDPLGTGGRLKASPDDFVVDEVSKPPPQDPDGRYSIAMVTARNWEMNRLVRFLARGLRISRDRIGFAGTKDKRAVTTQLMSFQVSPDDLAQLYIKDVTIADIYTSRKRMGIGDLIGNRFEIYVRECDMLGEELSKSILSTKSQLDRLGGYPNFFGVQRFGVVRPVTHKVGKMIVKGDIKGAAMTYACDPGFFEDVETSEARARLLREGDFTDAISYYPGKLTFERIVIGHLSREPEDWSGAIGALPRNLQMMFVHAYQSLLFNRMLSERMRRGMSLDRPEVGDVVLPLSPDRTPEHERPVLTTKANLDLVEKQVRQGKAFVSAPLFGSESVLSGGEMGEIERMVLDQEDIRADEFIVPEIPQCSSKGSRREILAPYSDLNVSIEPDGYRVCFTLTKGNYATTLMREFMKSDMTKY